MIFAYQILQRSSITKEISFFDNAFLFYSKNKNYFFLLLRIITCIIKIIVQCIKTQEGKL